MPGSTLEGMVREVMRLMDEGDADGMLACCALDVEIIDDISRTWLRGLDEVASYLRPLLADTQAIYTGLSDFSERTQSGFGVVTFWTVQTFMVDGRAHSVEGAGSASGRFLSGHWNLTHLQLSPIS